MRRMAFLAEKPMVPEGPLGEIGPAGADPRGRIEDDDPAMMLPCVVMCDCPGPSLPAGVPVSVRCAA